MDESSSDFYHTKDAELNASGEGRRGNVIAGPFVNGATTYSHNKYFQFPATGVAG